MLQITGLEAYYGKAAILRGVKLTAHEGEVTSVIGPNGAGKTTLLRAISRLIRSSGSISLDGESLAGLSPRAVIQKGVIQCPEGRQLFPRMSVHDNLLMGAFLRTDLKGIAGDLERTYELFPRLAERRRQLAGTLSGGEQQMLAIGRAIMSRPRLLMLDEPFLGLAPLAVQHIFEVMGMLHRGGLTTLLVEQNASIALKIAQRTYVIEEGRIAREGTSEALLRDTWIRQSYLGMA